MHVAADHQNILDALTFRCDSVFHEFFPLARDFPWPFLNPTVGRPRYIDIRFLLFVAVLVVVVLFAGTVARGALSWGAGRLSTRRALIVAVEDICATGKVVIFVLADFVPVAFFTYF
jgi:hypothetical protein